MLFLGRTIQLDQELGLPDGQHVQITIRPMTSKEGIASPEGLERAFGAWAAEADAVDEFLRWNREQRKLGRAESGP